MAESLLKGRAIKVINFSWVFRFSLKPHHIKNNRLNQLFRSPRSGRTSAGSPPPTDSPLWTRFIARTEALSSSTCRCTRQEERWGDGKFFYTLLFFNQFDLLLNNVLIHTLFRRPRMWTVAAGFDCCDDNFPSILFTLFSYPPLLRYCMYHLELLIKLQKNLTL